MAKRHRRRSGNRGFFLAMFLYSLLFLGAVGFGLSYLWDVLVDYEAREVYKDAVTVNPMDAYMEQLTPEHICDLSGDLIVRIDHSIQSEEECRRILLDALKGGFSRKKYVSAGAADRSEYAIFCGDWAIGKVTTQSHVEEKYGFTVWEIVEESYDLSYLLGEKISVTAPHSCTVTIGDRALDSSYVTGTTEYAYFEDFYEEYTLPYILTYEAGPFLGQPEAVITNAAGETITIDENTDWNVYIDNCTAEQAQELETFLDEFITSYVRFTSSKEDRFARYREVIAYMVDGGKLADRMYRALDGLQYNKILRAQIRSVTIHHLVDLGEGRYLCDLTYEINSTRATGTTVESNSVKIILLDTQKGLKAESMVSY